MPKDNNSSLKKYFSDTELQIIEEYAKANNLSVKDAIYRLAKENIETMSMRYINGQQVLSMMEMLALKFPAWFSMLLQFLSESSVTLNVLSKQMASITKPTATDKLLELLKDANLEDIIKNIIPLFINAFSQSKQEDSKDDEDDTL